LIFFKELFKGGKNGDNKTNHLENENQSTCGAKNQLNHQENQPTSSSNKIN